jgi:hypothetical protein
VTLAPNPHEGEIAHLQSSWKGPYKEVTQINDVVYSIQRNPRSMSMVVHLDREPLGTSGLKKGVAGTVRE